MWRGNKKAQAGIDLCLTLGNIFYFKLLLQLTQTNDQRDLF